MNIYEQCLYCNLEQLTLQWKILYIKSLRLYNVANCIHSFCIVPFSYVAGKNDIIKF